MSEYVIMPKADYVAACDAIREKTGKTDLIKSGDMMSEILGITTGGGSCEDVRYVTFMNEDGTVENGKKAVAVGDDCADPIARGVFDTPTKESTAQYNYTFSGGWATTPNGGIDSNALKAVTEDRTVYANFIAIVRSYTITFLDDDGSTLKSKSFTYGATPSYAPEKEGFSFVRWIPELAQVTGDASYTAQWKARTGLRFVSKATGVETGLGGTNLNSMLEVTNKGDKVVATYSNKKYKNIPVYNMSTPDATTEYIETPAERYLAYAVLNNTDDKILSYIGSPQKLETIGFDGTVTSQICAQIYATSFSQSSDSLFCRVRAGSKDYRIYKYIPGATSGYTDIAQLGDWQPYYIKVTKNDEYVVCVNGNDGTIRIYRIADGTLMQTISTGKTYAVNNLSVSADGKRFSIGWSAAPYVSVYSLETMEQICDLSGIITASSYAAFVGDILVVATGTAVRAFTIVDGVPEEYFEIPAYSGGSVSRIATSLNGNHIVFYDGNNIEMWSKV